MHRFLFEYCCALWTLQHMDKFKLVWRICLTLPEAWNHFLLKLFHNKCYQCCSRTWGRFSPLLWAKACQMSQGRVLGPWIHCREMTYSCTLCHLTKPWPVLKMLLSRTLQEEVGPLKWNSNSNTGKNVNCESRRLFSSACQKAQTSLKFHVILPDL